MANSKKIWKWVNVIALGALLLGGFNFLLMGLFEFDMFAAIFGGPAAAVSRIIYSIFGFAALIIFGTILWKALMAGEKKNAAAKTAGTGSSS